jgi:hypothetical protein
MRIYARRKTNAEALERQEREEAMSLLRKLIDEARSEK